MSSLPEEGKRRRGTAAEIGDQFHRWTVIGLPVRGKPKRYPCRCVCGTEQSVYVYDLVSGKTEGCIHCRSQHKQNSNYRHGGTRANWQSKLYQIWSAARQRCVNPNHKDWRYYGGRGITFCEEWHDFGHFRQWALANGYQEGLELDRADNAQGYSPENCRFVTHSENCYNRRSPVTPRARPRLFAEIRGEKKSLVEWSQDPRCRVSYEVLLYRYHHGKDLSLCVEE